MTNTSLGAGSGAAGTPPAAAPAPSANGWRKLTTVYVYEAPVRLWHWVNALSILVLCVTGYLIGSPLPTLSGEASAHYMMGTIRFVHFAAAYIFAIGFVGRALWALVGNQYSRELFTFPFWRKGFWRGLFIEVKWYAFLKPRPLKFVGHNPLAQVFMFWVMVVGGLFMIGTGFALYSEGEGLGSWQDRLFGWIIPALGGSMNVHTFHHIGMWVFILFIIIHVYSVIREDIMSRQSMVSAITNGYRTFRDDDPE